MEPWRHHLACPRARLGLGVGVGPRPGGCSQANLSLLDSVKADHTNRVWELFGFSLGQGSVRLGLWVG